MDSSLESVLGALRANTLATLSAAAQGAQQAQARDAAGHMADQAINARDLNTASLPVDPNRGRNLNIVV
jgi:hypothetical protein